MPNLFPSIQPKPVEKERGLPLYREAAWDFEAGKPLFRNGGPVIATGAEGVRVWMYKALRTARARYEIYTRDFGCELEALVGQSYSDGLKRAEAARYVREALECNPYITGIEAVEIEMERNALSIHATAKTIYGEVTIHV